MAVGKRKMALYETNRVEYKEKLAADLEAEAVASLNSEGSHMQSSLIAPCAYTFRR